MKKLVIVGLAVLALAGCAKSAPENALDEGNDTVAENLVAPVENMTAPEPANASNVVTPAAPPPTFSQDEQMRDDADATGMTARLPDPDAPAGQGGNETRPAE